MYFLYYLYESLIFDTALRSTLTTQTHENTTLTPTYNYPFLLWQTRPNLQSL